jgi:hypothetical protein
LSDTAARNDRVGAWLSLPRRIYLDTSTLQKLYDFGDAIFEGEPFEPGGPGPGLADEIDALPMIFMVKERAMFEFVVTEASLGAVVNRTRSGYTQWVYDVLDSSAPGRPMSPPDHPPIATERPRKHALLQKLFSPPGRPATMAAGPRDRVGCWPWRAYRVCGSARRISS